MISLQIIGKSAVDAKLGGFEARAAKTIDGAVQHGAQKFADRTKTLPPVSAKTTGYGPKGIPVDKGLLRQSIRTKKLAIFGAGVGPTVKHGVPVHEGTGRMPARPYLDWALELGGEEEIDRIIESAVSQLF